MQTKTDNTPEKTNQDTVFNKFIAPIDKFIDDQNKELPKHPNQKYSYYDFFRLLIYFFVSEVSSLKLLINNQLNKGLLPAGLLLQPVPYTTFNDAFERFPPELFHAAFRYLLSALKFMKIPELASLGIIYCIDGSLFPVISSMVWAEYTKKHNALKLHLCFELNRMIPVDFQLGSGNSSERSALIKMIAAGVTYIADRGYVSFSLFHHIVSSKAHFVFRVTENLVYNTLESLDINLPSSVSGLFENITDELIKYTNDTSGRIYRLVRFQTGGEIFCILTDRLDLSTFQVIMLYAYRWQVELMFRFLKRTMHGIHLIKQDKRGVTIQFYVLLVTALLQLYLKQDVMERAEAKNEKKAAETAEGIDDKPEKLISCGCEFVEIIGEKLNNFWKIGVYWLDSLRKLLASPFDDRTIEILGGL